MGDLGTCRSSGSTPTPAPPLRPARSQLLPGREAPGAPAITLIHGFGYVPGHPDRCPHDHILSLHPRPGDRAISWPWQLGFGRNGEAEDYASPSAGRPPGRSGRPTRRPRGGSAPLRRPSRSCAPRIPVPVDILGHSLGARVALEAFRHVPKAAVGRAIFLAGADTRANAKTALASPAGQTAEVVNVVTRDNTASDLLFRAAIQPHRPLVRTLGAWKLGRAEPCWLDLALDGRHVRASSAALGFPRCPAGARAAHWSAYLRPGLFPLYRALLRENLPLRLLRRPPRRMRHTKRITCSACLPEQAASRCAILVSCDRSPTAIPAATGGYASGREPTGSTGTSAGGRTVALPAMNFARLFALLTCSSGPSSPQVRRLPFWPTRTSQSRREIVGKPPRRVSHGQRADTSKDAFARSGDAEKAAEREHVEARSPGRTVHDATPPARKAGPAMLQWPVKGAYVALEFEM